MQIGTATKPVARKQHECWWCGETIKPKEKYARWLWEDGELLVIKVHIECREAWSTLPSDSNSTGYGEFSRGCCCDRGACRCKEVDDE